ALAVAVVVSRSRAPEAAVPRIAESSADRLDVRGSTDAVTVAGRARTGWLPSAHGLWAIHATAALSGMTALAAEVLWTRHLALLFGPTVYAFALILAVFLLGLGAGSGAGA